LAAAYANGLVLPSGEKSGIISHVLFRQILSVSVIVDEIAIYCDFAASPPMIMI